MIQHDKIIGLMKGTIPFNKKTLSGLSELVEEYPYFQTAHLLHTLNLLDLKDTHFLFDLRRTAVYVQNRKRLFFLVENSSFARELMEASEKETLPTDSPFELVDAFLSEKVEKTESEEPEELEEMEKLQNIEIESSPVATDYISYLLSDETENEEAPPLQHQDIIDKFLEKEAASLLKINLDKSNKPEEKMPESLELSDEPAVSDGFFSETLAKIYIKQKKYSKALEIINKLNLLYPEKNRYFADQIRFLEKLISNTNKTK